MLYQISVNMFKIAFTKIHISSLEIKLLLNIITFTILNTLVFLVKCKLPVLPLYSKYMCVIWLYG